MLNAQTCSTRVLFVRGEVPTTLLFPISLCSTRCTVRIEIYEYGSMKKVAVARRVGLAVPASRGTNRNRTRALHRVLVVSAAFKTDRSDLVEFLREDLDHLFDDQGIDVTKYDDRVVFRDPITSYNTIQGYLANIKFLKNIFQPKFTLHNIKQTGEDEITYV